MEVASEIVEWFDTLDANSRAELRELNELNFARFDAKLEQRVAELNGRFDRLEATVERLVAELNAKIDGGLREANARIDGLATKHELTQALLVQSRWMIFAWATTILTIVLRS